MATEKYAICRTSDGTEIPYHDEGSGQPIIFIHGLFGGSKDFANAIKSISRTYRCISYDQRGHGNSTADSGFEISYLANDLKELIDQLNLTNVIVIGYSMGAFTLFNYIDRFGTKQLSKIILIDITPKMLNDFEWKNGLYRGKYSEVHLQSDFQKMDNNFMEFANYFTYRNMTKYTEARPFSKRPTLLSKTVARFIIGKNKARHDIYATYWRNVAQLDFREMLVKIDVPTAIFYADPGSLFTPEVAKYMQAKIPGGAKLVPFFEATHALVFSHEKQFINNVLEFAGM